MANRYTKLTASKFSPLTREDIFSVPVLKRKQHNTALVQAEQLKMFDNAGTLAVDQSLVNNETGSYQKQIDAAINTLQSEGFNPNTMQNIMALNSKKRALLAPTGNIGKAKTAYDAYIKNNDEQRKAFLAGHISKDKYEQGIARAVDAYKGVQNGSIYTPFLGVRDTKVSSIAQKVAKDAAAHPDSFIEKLKLVKKVHDDGSVSYYDQIEKRYKTKEDLIKGAVTLALHSPAVFADLKQRHELGLIGFDTVEDYIDNVATNYEKVYAINQKKVDLKATKGTAGNKGEHGISYDNDGISTMHAGDQKFLNYVKAGLDNTSATVVNTPDYFRAGHSPYLGDTGRTKKVSSTKYNKQYEELAKKLISEHKLGDKFDYTSGVYTRDAVEAVSKYMQDYSDKLTLVNTYVDSTEDTGSGVDTFLPKYSNNTKLDSGLFNDVMGGDRKAWVTDSGVPIKPEDYVGGKLIYGGYYTPDSSFSNDKYQGASDNALVIPIRATLLTKYISPKYPGERINIIIDRKRSEINTLNFQASKAVHTIFQKAHSPNSFGTFVNIDVAKELPVAANKMKISNMKIRYNVNEDTYDLEMKYLPTKKHGVRTYSETLNISELKALMNNTIIK